MNPLKNFTDNKKENERGRVAHHAILVNLQLNYYSIEHTATESSRTLPHISKRLSYQLRNALRLYDSTEN